MKLICPAYAGMIPKLTHHKAIFINLSRVCGDDPVQYAEEQVSSRFVPRMRGGSLILYPHYLLLTICPAYAGRIPLDKKDETARKYLSRVCEDDPGDIADIAVEREFVARMRG